MIDISCKYITYWIDMLKETGETMDTNQFHKHHIAPSGTWPKMILTNQVTIACAGALDIGAVMIALVADHFNSLAPWEFEWNFKHLIIS